MARTARTLPGQRRERHGVLVPRRRAPESVAAIAAGNAGDGREHTPARRPVPPRRQAPATRPPASRRHGRRRPTSSDDRRWRRCRWRLRPGLEHLDHVDCHVGSTTPGWYDMLDAAAPTRATTSQIAATKPSQGRVLNVTWNAATDACPSNPVGLRSLRVHGEPPGGGLRRAFDRRRPGGHGQHGDGARRRDDLLLRRPRQGELDDEQRPPGRSTSPLAWRRARRRPRRPRRESATCPSPPAPPPSGPGSART